MSLKVTVKLNRYSPNKDLKADFNLGSSAIAEGRRCRKPRALAVKPCKAVCSHERFPTTSRCTHTCVPFLCKGFHRPPPFTRWGLVREGIDALIMSSVAIFTILIYGVKAITQQNMVSQLPERTFLSTWQLTRGIASYYTSSKDRSQWETWNILPLFQFVN